jgi:hypothetical protein
MTQEHNDRIVQNGCRRARSAHVSTIRSEVQQEFAERLKSAWLFKQLLLRLAMWREIERRLDRVAPPWGLYFFS